MLKDHVKQPLCKFFAYCTDKNRSYMNVPGKNEKSCGLYEHFSQMYHKLTTTKPRKKFEWQMWKATNLHMHPAKILHNCLGFM